MIRYAALILSLIVMGGPVLAQTNDNSSTPLNSRIKRDRPFPTEPRNIFERQALSELGKKRSRDMVGQFSRCLWDRSNEKGLDLLARTDYGFRDWSEIGLEQRDITRNYAIETCLNRVASRNGGISMRFNASSIRRWYLYEAYIDSFPEGPDWARSGYMAGKREYPISANRFDVLSAMDFADCIVAQDPHAADYYIRTIDGSDEEKVAIGLIIPAIELCVPAGQEMDITPIGLRVWLGEGLWHASNNSVPAPVEETQEP